jgi:adenylyltransferase/sulfurtransferase
VHAIASVEVAEALKLLVGATDKLNDGLLAIDLWNLTFEQVPLGEPRPECPACGKKNFAYLNQPASARETVLCGQDSVQVRVNPPVHIDLDALARRLRGAGDVQLNRFLLRFTDNATSRQLTVFPDGRAIISGTSDGDEARRLYATYIGV